MLSREAEDLQLCKMLQYAEGQHFSQVVQRPILNWFCYGLGSLRLLAAVMAEDYDLGVVFKIDCKYAT